MKEDRRPQAGRFRGGWPGDGVVGGRRAFADGRPATMVRLRRHVGVCIRVFGV